LKEPPPPQTTIHSTIFESADIEEEKVPGRSWRGFFLFVI